MCVTGTTVLGIYCAHILSLQAVLTGRLGRAVRLPLAIMTSSDTHEMSLKLLQVRACVCGSVVCSTAHTASQLSSHTSHLPPLDAECELLRFDTIAGHLLAAIKLTLLLTLTVTLNPFPRRSLACSRAVLLL